MKSFIFILCILLQFGCSKEPSSLAPQNAVTNEAGFSIEGLQSTRVQELFVIIFAKNYSPQEWKSIFQSTDELSLNRKKLRDIEGSLEPEAENLRAELLGRNADLLTDLGKRAIFILNWTLSDENCRIRSNVNQQTLLQCKYRNLDNPLNGGLPTSVDPLRVVYPNPVTSDNKTPYLRILLNLSPSDTAQGYSLELRLRPESITEESQWFKGEVLPSAGSSFRASDGNWTQAFFPFGYAEMTLTR